MANYVYQQVICSREFFEKFFIDYSPIQKDNCLNRPYISFNKIVGVNSLNEYKEKFGEYIYYGYGFSYVEHLDGRIVLKFVTKWNYPMAAIQCAISLDHSIEWYAVEESEIYVSKFYWEEGLQEMVALLGDEFHVWAERQYVFEEELSDENHILWYFLKENQVIWIPWTDDLALPRYFEL